MRGRSIAISLSLLAVMSSAARGPDAFARSAGGGGAVLGEGKPPADVQSLADAELAFAKTANEKGVRDAFVEHLGKSAILLRPGPVNGREFMSKRPSNAGPLLAWEPSYVEVAASGELGWDTGPWSFKPDRAKDAVGWGHFATVWQKDETGRWWPLIDHGHDMAVAGPPEPLVWGRTSGGAGSAGAPAAFLSDDDAKTASSELAAADKGFGEAIARGGLKAGLVRYAAPDVRVYREGTAPVIGSTSALAAFPNEWKGGVTETKPYVGTISKAGDLGFTYGTVALADTSVSKYGRNYMRVWRRNGPEGWRLALDVVNEIPPPPAAAPK